MENPARSKRFLPSVRSFKKIVLKRFFPFEGPCSSSDHSQCKAPGNDPGSSGGMLCDVECINRCLQNDTITTLTSNQCVTMLFIMTYDIIYMHAGHGFQLRDIQTTQKVKATQVIGTWDIYDGLKEREVVTKWWKGIQSNGFRCCRRRCADHSPCADGEWGCEVGWQSLISQLSTCLASEELGVPGRVRVHHALWQGAWPVRRHWWVHGKQMLRLAYSRMLKIHTWYLSGTPGTPWV